MTHAVRVEDNWLKGRYYGRWVVEIDDSLPKGDDVTVVVVVDYQRPGEDLDVIAARYAKIRGLQVVTP